jgi:phosphoribosyl-ATP pyrophosphohydrolase/phosphoribosyl-AMP cyclohydrolase/histidinol dehydrogenase
MATPILISYDPSSPTSDSGLSLKQIAYFGRVLVKVSTLDQAEKFLRQNFRTLDVFVDATEITSAGDLVDILNAGAAKILITLDQLTTLSEEQSVPSSRLLVNAQSDSQLDTLQQWIAANAERSEASVCTASATVSAAADKLKISSDSPRLFTTITDNSEDVITQVTQQGAIAVVSSQALTVERDVSGKISAAKLIASRAVTDQANGLFATSVTDERGACLGFVWSSDESIAEALRTGTGVYQSRKRGLWYKGQSSGDVQELLRIGFDCDADCLVFVVKQIGRGKDRILLFVDICMLTLIRQAFATSVLRPALARLPVCLVYRRH